MWKKEKKTKNNEATAYYQGSCKKSTMKGKRLVNVNEKLDLWEDQIHLVSSNYF